tara:strand:- start:1692 stop:2501 length:810 start_codon:yes stop_codon:yes gene_type:complete
MKITITSILFLVFLSGSVDATNIEVQNELKRGYPEGMVFIKGGCFKMGDQFGENNDDENPVHEVCVDDLFLGEHEVTQIEWREVMGKNPSGFKNCGGDCPVESVSWNDVQQYINNLNNKTGMKYRLPKEAEWEYAAREGGKKVKFAGFSNEKDLSQYANFCDENCELAWKTKNQNDGSKNTAPVKSYKPNSLGLYDMAGNVWEWVSDRYGDYYGNSPRLNPEGPASGNYRVIRGGSWGTEPMDVRAAKRSRYFPIIRNPYIGFRLAHNK